MNKIFNMQNLYTTLFIISIYSIFTLIFGDILRSKEFNIGLKTVPLLIISILFFGLVNRYYFNNTAPRLLKTQIIVILAVSIIFSLLLQKVIYINEVSDFSEKKFQNPLYKEFVEIANKNNLDLSFTKTAWIQRGPNNYKINTIFEKKKKSIDILFFGDSSIAWGLIPKVIEQMTGKTVAIYAYESNVLTVKTSKLFNKISQYYLKDDGIVIFSFDNWTKDKAPNHVIISKKQCDEIIAWQSKDFEKYAKQNEINLYDKYFSFTAFESLYNQKSEYLKSRYGLYLKSPSFYEDYIEPIINPLLHASKFVNKNDKTKYIRWDMDSITLYNTDFKTLAIHSEVMPDKPLSNQNIQLNAEAAATIFEGIKIYMVPLYHDNNRYKISRNMYYSYYKNLDFQLSDLGLFTQKEEKYIMQGGSHMGNTGGLMKSILIGKWLKQYLNDNTIANSTFIEFDFIKIYKDKYDALLKNTPKNSTIYLAKSFLNNKVVDYFKDNNRFLVSAIPDNNTTFYYMDKDIDVKLLKSYQLNPININTLAKYLKQYSKDTIILSVRDEGSRSLSIESKKYFRDLNISIDKLRSRGSFAALIDNNETVTYDINNTSEISLDVSLLKKYGIQKIVSSGYKNGNKSIIQINGKNISKQRRGINYVIKKNDGSTISGFVDTHLDDSVGVKIIKATSIKNKE